MHCTSQDISKKLIVMRQTAYMEINQHVMTLYILYLNIIWKKKGKYIAKIFNTLIYLATF